VTLPILDADKVAIEINSPFKNWYHDCHGISLAIVKSQVLPALGFPVRRVARGGCRGVLGQHSWIVLGPDPYDTATPIVDPTLWSYRDDVTGIYVGDVHRYRHVPHGGGSTIWKHGRPPEPVREPMPLPADLVAALSPLAAHFLKMCGPLDWHGWSFLCNAPVTGWPAAEIISAMSQSRQHAVIIPIDRLGMLTDQNPEGLYLPDDWEKVNPLYPPEEWTS